jgi:hypothetical protein
LQSLARLWKSCGVIPEIDIWRAATLMLKRYGQKALEESAARVDELATAAMMTAWRSGAGSRTPSGNSPTQPRPARSTDDGARRRPLKPPPLL